MATMMSPRFSPAAFSGLSGCRLTTSAPSGRAMPSELAISAVTSCSSTPSQGRLIAEPTSAEATTVFTMLAGMAKPMPMEPPDFEKIAVLMPTSSPAMLTSAPPELPGLMAASVWMKKLIVADADLGTRQRRDDAAGHRLSDAEGIADGKHQIAHFEAIGVAQGQGRQLLVAHVDPKHRKVGALICQHDAGLELAAVGQNDLDVGARRE